MTINQWVARWDGYSHGGVMNPSAYRVAQQWVRSKQELEPRWHNHLKKLTDGSPVALYHGTTRSFKRFELARSREELVKNYYGKGIFLTPSVHVAYNYAHANRNIGFDPSIIDDLKRVNSNAGDLLETLFTVGNGEDFWDSLFDSMPPHPKGQAAALDDHLNGADANTLNEIAEYIIGTKAGAPSSADQLEQLMGLMGGGQQRTGTPDGIYNSLDEIGLDSNKYRPKVYSVTVSGIFNPLITTRLDEAKKAQSKGYDAVVYHGSQAVAGVPEVAIFDPRKVEIKNVAIVG